MANLVIKRPERLPEPLDSGKYLHRSEIQPHHISLYIAVAVGLVDCFLKQQPGSEESERLRDIIKTTMTEDYLAADPSNSHTVKAYYDRLCNWSYIRKARHISSQSRQFFVGLANGVIGLLGGSFPEEYEKLHIGQRLLDEEVERLLEGAAMIWRVSICLYYDNSRTMSFGVGNSVDQIALWKGRENSIFLLYDEQAYFYTMPPHPNELREDPQREEELLGLTQILNQHSRMRIYRSSVEHHSTTQDFPSSEGRAPMNECKNCGSSTGPESGAVCRGHMVCNACRVKTIAFGTARCPVSTCGTAYRSDDFDALILLSSEYHKVPIFPLGTFTCRSCQEVQFWDLKVECRCNLCRHCERPCFCQEDSGNAICGLCKTSAIDPFLTPCGHLFCHSCAWIHFFSSFDCPECGFHCELEDIQSASSSFNASMQESREFSKLSLIRALASIVLNPNQSFAGLHSHFETSMQQTPIFSRPQVELVYQYALAAANSARSCCNHHEGVRMLCNCGNRHCLSCLLTDMRQAREQEMPLFCRCGSLIDEEHQGKLREIQVLLN